MQININTIAENINRSASFKALPKKYTEVDRYLIRGPHPQISDVFKLKKEGVNRIYDFRHCGVKGFKWVEKLACRVAGIEYIKKPYSFIEHKYPTQAEYEAVAKEVRENGERGGRTLFHCNSGTHRTSLMAAFYAITKGKPLAVCKREDADFENNLKNVINQHIFNSRFFSRNRVISDTRNPFLKLKNAFNNKVQETTQRAYEMFLIMMNPNN